MKLADLPNIQTIAFRGLSFKHENHDSTLSNVDFDFSTHKIVRIQSPEGAGKSTLLQILAGLLIPQSGEYLLNGKDVVQMSFEDFLPFRLRIGYTFDYGGLINNRTINDNLMLPLMYHKLIPYNDAKKRVENLIKKFDITRFAHERPAHVPGRVRKLGCVLRALIIHPQMLLMDDPSVGLGVETVGALVAYLRELQEMGHLQHIFVSTYDEKFMGLLEHEVLFLDGGQLYFHEADSIKKVANL